MRRRPSRKRLQPKRSSRSRGRREAASLVPASHSVRLVSDTVSDSSLTPCQTRLGHHPSRSDASFVTIRRRKRNDSGAGATPPRGRRYGREMGRRARAFHPGRPTHLTARGVDDQPIFRSDLDRYELLALLRKMTERIEWQVLCWCLMTTHYHLRCAHRRCRPSGSAATLLLQRAGMPNSTSATRRR